MTHIGYKAPGSLPGEHETLIPFKQLANNFFRCGATGRKSDCHPVSKPLGVLGEGIVVLKNG
jgi:hypothetical protein